MSLARKQLWLNFLFFLKKELRESWNNLGHSLGKLEVQAVRGWTGIDL